MPRKSIVKANTFKGISESELCERFAEYARSLGWTVWPEIGDWDLVLTRNDAPTQEQAQFLCLSAGTQYAWKSGDQVGVQAKLKPSFGVLEQATRPGPRWRVVLVSKHTDIFERVCGALNVGLVSPVGKCWYCQWTGPYRYHKRLKLPSFVPNLPAGVPSPRTLSPWREAALRFLLRLREGERVTQADIKAAGLHPKLWVRGKRSWLVDTGTVRENTKTGRLSKLYALRPDAKNLPDVGYDSVLQQIKAEEHNIPLKVCQTNQ